MNNDVFAETLGSSVSDVYFERPIVVTLSEETLHRAPTGVSLQGRALGLDEQEGEAPMGPFADLVVLVPGILGSVLANPEGKEVWNVGAGAVWRAVTSLGGSLTNLEVAADGTSGGVSAPRLMPDATIIPGFWKVDGYDLVQSYMIEQLGLTRDQNFFVFPYDWRLDNRIHAKRLEATALDWLKRWRSTSGNTDARLVLVCHSMGGLVARYFLECLEGWKHTRYLITLGTPHRGALNAVDFLVHGMRKGVGPFGIDLSQFLRSCPSVYQLLPIYPCVETEHDLPLVRVAQAAESGLLPHIEGPRAAAARAFHQEIEDAQASNATLTEYQGSGTGYQLVPLVGIEQPTKQMARVRGGKVDLLNAYKTKVDTSDEFRLRDMGGDGTVPRISATPIELSDVPRDVYAADAHGSLQNALSVLVNIKGILTRPQLDLRTIRSMRANLPPSLTLELDDLILPEEPLAIRALPSNGAPFIETELRNLTTGESFAVPLKRDGETGWQKVELSVAPGTWRVRIQAEGASPVTDLTVVAEAS